MTAAIIDMKQWDLDRLKKRAEVLTYNALRAMSDEQRERLMRQLERHVEIKAE